MTLPAFKWHLWRSRQNLSLVGGLGLQMRSHRIFFTAISSWADIKWLCAQSQSRRTVVHKFTSPSTAMTLPALKWYHWGVASEPESSWRAGRADALLSYETKDVWLKQSQRMSSSVISSWAEVLVCNRTEDMVWVRNRTKAELMFGSALLTSSLWRLKFGRDDSHKTSGAFDYICQSRGVWLTSHKSSSLRGSEVIVSTHEHKSCGAVDTPFAAVVAALVMVGLRLWGVCTEDE
jgi:hypothetical protein